ncbi:4'-phosphopantetheinyl transferase family protein [Gallaecimonas xiamenensis]|nr:hypothetical protein [Gallaecimonas xiamenensis]
MPSLLWCRCPVVELLGDSHPPAAKSAQRLAAQHLGSLLLGRFLGRPVAPDELKRDETGAPWHPEAKVSLSHSGAWVAAAVSDQLLGIDIEVPKSRRPLGAMADWLGWPQQHFYRRWCAYEAAIKTWGRAVAPEQLLWGEKTVTAPGLAPLFLYNCSQSVPLVIASVTKLRPRWQSPILMKAECLIDCGVRG